MAYKLWRRYFRGSGRPWEMIKSSKKNKKTDRSRSIDHSTVYGWTKVK